MYPFAFLLYLTFLSCLLAVPVSLDRRVVETGEVLEGATDIISNAKSGMKSLAGDTTEGSETTATAEDVVHDEEEEDNCPSVDQLPTPDDLWAKTGHLNAFYNNIANTVDYLGGGEDGCAYLLIDGDFSVVAKTRVNPGDQLKANEVAALKGLQQFYGTVSHTLPGESEEREFYFQEYQPGVSIRHTEGWKQYVSDSGKDNIDPGKSVDECKLFLGVVRGQIADRAAQYAEQIGFYHNDMHFGNIKFPEDWHPADPTSIEEMAFIDWGDAVPAEGTSSIVALAEGYFNGQYNINEICTAKK